MEPAEVTHAEPEAAEIELGGPDLTLAELDDAELLDG